MVSTVVLNMKILIESLAHTVLYYNITIKTLVDRGKIIVYNCIFNFFYYCVLLKSWTIIQLFPEKIMVQQQLIKSQFRSMCNDRCRL